MFFSMKPEVHWNNIVEEVEKLFILLRSVDDTINPIPLVGVSRVDWKLFDAPTGSCRYIQADYRLTGGQVRSFNLAFHKPFCHLFITGDGSTEGYKVVTPDVLCYSTIDKQIVKSVKQLRSYSNKLHPSTHRVRTFTELRDPAKPRVLSP